MGHDFSTDFDRLDLLEAENKELKSKLEAALQRVEEAELDAKLWGEAGASAQFKLKECESRLEACQKELAATQDALAAYAQDRWGGGTKAVEKLLGINRCCQSRESAPQNDEIKHAPSEDS